MTQQSGQGAASPDPRQPAERHAHEGIVLPADGGEPLMPGGHQAAPPVGSPWGQPWGPEPSAPSPGAGEAWGAAGQPGQAAPVTGGMPLPPEGTPLPPAMPPAMPYETGAGASGQFGTPLPPESHALPPEAHGLPPETHGLPPEAHGLPPVSQPLPPPSGHVGPMDHGAYPGHTGHTGYSGYTGYAGYEEQTGQAGHAGYQDHTGHTGHTPQAPHPPHTPHAGYGQPLSAADHTQVLRPTDPGPSGGPLPSPGQPLAPGPGHGPGQGPDAEATQYIAPVAPGALPPEISAAAAPDSTQFLGRADATQFLGQAADVVPEEAAYAGDNAPTQFIAPVTDSGRGAPPAAAAGHGERQPPAEFDNLFRRELEPDGAPSSTQQMPRVSAPAPVPVPDPEPAPRRRGRTGSRTPLLIGVGVAIAVVGVGAGAMLAGGGGDAKAEDKQPLAASSPDSGADDDKDKGGAKPSPSADPAKRQAVALDKLLADSNDSRESVISAVRNVGKCQNLRQSATDLRDAAKQRNGLVGRLSGLTVDKLPAHARLTAALNRAWRASASADNHYAAWADQVGGKKGCRKGHARNTAHTAAGNRASGEATKAKQQAAALWNAIAQKHGLTKRIPTQL
ncbi:hypothetical protein RB200_12795 [Streptomyces sp. PmtG]